MNRTMTDQIDQIEKPMCSVATDQTRLRRATALLPASQAAVSSGSHSRMTRVRGAVSALRRVERPGLGTVLGAVVFVLKESPRDGRWVVWGRGSHARKPVLHLGRSAVTRRLQLPHEHRDLP